MTTAFWPNLTILVDVRKLNIWSLTSDKITYLIVSYLISSYLISSYFYLISSYLSYHLQVIQVVRIKISYHLQVCCPSETGWAALHTPHTPCGDWPSPGGLHSNIHHTILWTLTCKSSKTGGVQNRWKTDGKQAKNKRRNTSKGLYNSCEDLSIAQTSN